MASYRPRCFLDIDIGAEPAGRLTIELFTDQTPKTCENFRALCNGTDAPLSYRMTPFHRVIDEFMLQGGDTTAGDGTGGASIYGGEFEDENLKWREVDAAGLVCMANRGKGTNSSQFFITLEPCPHLNGKHTVFGTVVSGRETMQRMAKVRVDDDDRPLEPVLVARCGELEKRKKEAPTTTTTSDREADHRRRSASSSRSASRERRGTERERPKRPRRQSDNIVDETRRGRPRSRSASPPHERDVSPDPPKHKRKRSQSPSRGRSGEERDRDSRERSPEYRRRRRSLPNQYHEDSYQRRDRAEDRPRDWDRPRYDRVGGDRRPRRDERYDGRRNTYRPNGGRDGRLNDDGRLGGNAGDDGSQNESGIKFKGRGSMKFREPDRRW